MFKEHPFKETKTGSTPENVIRCPVCSSKEFDAHQNEFETFRDCRKCGNRWSGGSVGATRPDYAGAQAPPPGIPAPDDDLPCNDFTGHAFRPWE